MPGRNDHFDLLRRQLERRLDGIERRFALRTQLIEGDAADEDLHVPAIPSRRRAEAAVVGGGKLAAPVDQRMLPFIHRVLKRRIAADRAGFGRRVRRRRDQVGAGGTLDSLRPGAGRRAAGIDDKKQHPPQLDGLFRLERAVWRIGSKARNGETGKPVIVHHPAVEQLHVPDLAGVIAMHGVGEELEERRSVRIMAHTLHPFRQRHRASARETLNDDRREDDRHGRGSGDRKRNRIIGEVAAQRSEQNAAKDKRRAIVDVGGVDPDVWPPLIEQALEGRVLEQIVVEPFREQGRFVDAAL